MKFLRINSDTLEQGATTFDSYVQGAVCGKADRYSQTVAKTREGGLKAVPGATIACLDSGILVKQSVICAVARATRCRQSTVEAFLNHFIPSAAGTDVFVESDGLMLEQRLLRNNVIIAA